ncbi:MAG: hypothetical protein ABI693_14430 [Bryobacteraceae bacterium]
MKTLTAIPVLLAAAVTAFAQGGKPRPVPLEGLSGFLQTARGTALRNNQQTRKSETVKVTPDAPDAASCGSAAGTRFNLEARTPPGALPQNETVVDFLPGAGLNGNDLVVGTASDFRGFFAGLGDSATGYYVHRGTAATSPCAADFEGGLPAVIDQLTGITLLGGGDAAIAADPARQTFFLADNRQSDGVSTIAVFRTTVATLNNSTACPDGTHSPTAAMTCWPTSIEVSPRADGSVLVKPHLAIDPHTGAVYVTAILSNLSGSHPILSVCRADLSACSAPAILAADDTSSRSAHVRVRPYTAPNATGAITLTYVNVHDTGAPNFSQIFDIKYITCTPQAAAAPLCGTPSLVRSETQPIPATSGGLGGGALASSQFIISTYPKHEHRQDSNGIETYIVWDRCQVPNAPTVDICPNAGIAMAASADNGVTWKFGVVDNSPGDQYFPWIATDSTNTLNIVYYSTRADAGNHRAQVVLRQIPPGALTPDPVSAPITLTTTGMEPNGDFFLGDFFIGNNIGVAARSTASGRRMYVHFMNNSVNGVYNGAPSPEQNNHLTRLDY